MINECEFFVKTYTKENGKMKQNNAKKIFGREL